MLTLQEHKEIHAKVKSGADFPAYIQAIKNKGISSYETYVSDGHTVFRGENNEQIISEPKYPNKHIADTSSVEMLKNALSIHQQGQTDYPTFCQQAADAGVDKWAVSTGALTCTYLNKAAGVMLEESIPQA
ncbi:MAG: DUF1398 family protein [Bacteroidota bacterium]